VSEEESSARFAPMEEALAGLPGASGDAGEGPVVPALLETMLLAEGTVASARDAAHAWYADLVGPLLVPADATEGIQEQVEPGDLGLRIVLVAQPGPGDPAGLLGLREARNRLLDDDRLELTGVHIPLPASQLQRDAVDDLLAELDLTVPAWIEVTPSAGWEQALETLAADGAEHLALRLGDALVAALLRRAVDLDLSLRVAGVGGGAASTVQLLAALCAVRAALNGADVPEITAVLAERRVAPLTSALRRMSDADAAVARAFLEGVVVPDVAEAARDLAALGLVKPQE
jgi:hypothetical protein